MLLHTHSRAAVAARPTALLATLVAAVLGVAFALFASPASPAHAHDQLIDITIDAGDNGEASAVRLAYSDSVLKTGIDVIITAPDGSSAAKGLPTVERNEVTQQLSAPLADGTYSSAWRVVSSDGHPIEGAFAFDVKNGVAGDVKGTDDAAHDDDHDHSGEAADHEHADDHDHSAAEEATDAAAPLDASADDEGSNLLVRVVIGLAILAAIAAIAIPLIMRARKNATQARNTAADDAAATTDSASKE